MSLKLTMEINGITTYPGLGESEFSMNCPFCGDKKHHLQVSERKNLYYCFRRGCSGRVHKLLKKLKIFTVKKFYSNSNFFSLEKKLKDILIPFETSLEGQQAYYISTFKGILTSEEKDAILAFKYLSERNIEIKDILNYDLRYCTIGKYKDRIIIPFYENGECVYFQARLYKNLTPGVQKVLSPSEAELYYGKSHWLFNFDRAKKYEEVIICEGWASAITAGNNAISIQGNIASSVQLHKIITNWKKYIILLDSDAKNQAYNLAQQLLTKSLYSKVKIVTLPVGDPNDYSKKEINDMIQKETFFEPEDFLKRRLECISLM